jgi:predicted transcriptional regulator
MASVPRDGADAAAVLALSENRKRVLDALLALDDEEAATIADAAAAIAARADPSEATVKRYLYELADEGVLARVPATVERGGREPSRVEPRFPTRVYRRLRARG